MKINSRPIIQRHFCSDFTLRQDSEIHYLHFTASDIPLQSFSYTKVSSSPVITSIRPTILQEPRPIW